MRTHLAHPVEIIAASFSFWFPFWFPLLLLSLLTFAAHSSLLTFHCSPHILLSPPTRHDPNVSHLVTLAVIRDQSGLVVVVVMVVIIIVMTCISNRAQHDTDVNDTILQTKSSSLSSSSSSSRHSHPSTHSTHNTIQEHHTHANQTQTHTNPNMKKAPATLLGTVLRTRNQMTSEAKHGESLRERSL